VTEKSSLFNNSVFRDALAEIEALGFRVSDKPSHDSTPYGIIGGRTNQRWWLVPLNDRRLTISGLALFQPVTTSAKLLKSAAVMASNLGLSSVWTRKQVYVSGNSVLEDVFAEKDLSYAFFTGTDSPHRKVAVQVMDRTGRIRGFAKVSKNASVKPFLNHEANTLNYLNTLDLQTTLIPKVLFCGEIGGVEVLVTDSLKTSRSKTVTALNDAHLAFLRELAEKTAVPVKASDMSFVADLRKQYVAVSERLTVEWRQRLEKALAVLESSGSNLGVRALGHGDFTPWNTFFVDGKLYVFDWEYASDKFSVGYDLIHFGLASSVVKNQTSCDVIDLAKKVLLDSELVLEASTAELYFLGYLCGHTLHYAGREPEVSGEIMSLDGSQDAAFAIDAIIERNY
jgi:hypothetical protein